MFPRTKFWRKRRVIPSVSLTRGTGIRLKTLSQEIHLCLMEWEAGKWWQLCLHRLRSERKGGVFPYKPQVASMFWGRKCTLFFHRSSTISPGCVTGKRVNETSQTMAHYGESTETGAAEACAATTKKLQNILETFLFFIGSRGISLSVLMSSLCDSVPWRESCLLGHELFGWAVLIDFASTCPNHMRVWSCIAYVHIYIHNKTSGPKAT